MVSSTTRKIISLAISLLVVVISLAGVALGATVPTVATLTSGPNGNGRYTPGFTGAPGKMVRDVAGNFYVTDFWGKGVVKLDNQGNKIGFISTNGRPSAVAVLPDSRLIVAVAAPQAKIAFYSQATGEEITATPFGVPAKNYFRPTGITVDAAGYIYVIDSGDANTSTTVNVGTVRVYSSAGAYLYAFGVRTHPLIISAVGGEFKQPMGIVYEKQNNHVVVVDTMNSRLQFFSAFNGTSCTYVKSVGSSVFGTPTVGGSVQLGDPTDVAFEYQGANLARMYVTERSRSEVSVVDMENLSPTYGYDLKRINATTVTGSEMKYPSGVVFEKTATGGVLYVSNAAATNPSNVLALGVDSGTVPAQTVTMTINAVPPTSSASPITVTGTTTPATGVTCSVNGGAGIAATGSGSWSADIPLVDNAYNYIRCQTTSGGAYKEAYTYKGAPAAAPVIDITQPSAAIVTTGLTVTVKGTSSMANTDVQLVNSLTSLTTTAQTDADNPYKWSAVVTLAAGSNLITATGSKPGTSVSDPRTVTVTSDSTRPVLTVSFLNTGSTSNEAVQNVDGIVDDATIGVNIGDIKVNGVTVPAVSRVAMGGTLTYFSVPVTLDRGANTITVTATDLAGNTPLVPYERTVTLNPEIPGLSVALPADNSFMKGVSTASASGTAATSFTAINAAGSSVTPSAGAWVTLTDFAVSGSLSPYMFKASGGGNTEVTLKRTILNDASYAKLAITDPPADLSINTSAVTIKGQVAPGFTPAPEISIDGAAFVAVTPDGDYATTGKFSYVVTLPEEKLYVIKVKADGTTAVRNIIRDTLLPQLTVQADSKAMPTTIHGSIEPSAKISGITATLNSTPVMIPVSRVTFDTYDGSGAVAWHADLTGYTYDAISFSSLDPAGNLKALAYEKGIPTGDVDGDGTVRLADALAALRHVAGTEVITDPIVLFNGDVGALVDGRAARDGAIDITDSVLILNKAYGLMTF